MEGTSQIVEAKNESENLLLRRTQGDLLHKLRQLQQWRQQQEEHLQQDKEKQLSLLRDKERRLHAVQEYQRKILQNNNMIPSRMDISSLQEVNATGFPNGQSLKPVAGTQPSESLAMSYSGVGYNPPTRTVLLSPQHFKVTSSNMNASYMSPAMKPHSQMLLTQKLQLPSTGDDELSQFTESDGGSIGGIEGIRPIEDTPSELSAATGDEDHFSSSDEEDNNNTLVHHDHHQNECNDDDDVINNDHDVINNDHDIDYNDDIDQDNDDHDIEDDDLEQDNDNHNVDDDDIEQENDDHDIDDIDQDSDHDIEDNDRQAVHIANRDANSKPTFDEIPIKPGLGDQARTFEELLNQQLEAEQQDANHEQQKRPKSSNAAKRTFLKKGEGLSRFGVKTKTVVKPVTHKERGNDAVEQKAPITRKTATAKDYTTAKQSAMSRVTETAFKQKSVVNQSITAEQIQFDARKLNVSKSSTAQQTIRPVTGNSLSYESDQEKQPFSPKKVQFNTRQSRHAAFTEDILEEHLGSSSEDGELEQVEHTAGGSEVIIEDSFQERMKKWDELEVVEKQELNEFELLEEAAAANCSLSSNSSTVLRILGKKQEQRRADVNNNVIRARQKLDGKGIETLKVDANETDRTLTAENLDDDIDDADTLHDSEVITVRSSLALSDGFDDTKTWDENNALDVSDVNDDVIHALNTSTPDEKGERRSAHVQNTTSVPVSSTPPTSALVKKLFPQLKTKKETSQLNQKHPMPQQSVPPATAFRLDADDGLNPGTNSFRNPGINAGLSSGIDAGLNSGINPGLNSRVNPGLNSEMNPGLNPGMSNAVRDKLQELEKEIEKFREENIALHRLREEREKDLQELQREKTLFENYKTEEVQRLEKFKTEEEKRLRLAICDRAQHSK